MMKKILLTGASGFLGWNVCNLWKNDWKIFGLVFSHVVDIPGVNVMRVDLTRYEEVKRVFFEVRPDVVMHLAAVSAPNYCQEHRVESTKINVDASVNIAGLCADRSIPCVFTSSDLVFDGQNPPYREEDPVCPVNAYGEQKVMAEQRMQEIYPQATICRMPLMFGRPAPASESFVQPMVRAMVEGKALKLFTDERRSPLSAEDAAQGLLLAMEKVEGMIHLGGAESISRFDFGRLLADVLGMQGARLTPCLQRDVKMAAPRPRDVSLDSTKAFSLGFKPAPLTDGLAHLADRIR
jgi:dTDP-4-dehydrorhamnose reductase